MGTPVHVGMLGCGFIGGFRALGLRPVRQAVLHRDAVLALAAGSIGTLTTAGVREG